MDFLFFLGIVPLAPAMAGKDFFFWRRIRMAPPPPERLFFRFNFFGSQPPFSPTRFVLSSNGFERMRFFLPKQSSLLRRHLFSAIAHALRPLLFPPSFFPDCQSTPSSIAENRSKKFLLQEKPLVRSVMLRLMSGVASCRPLRDSKMSRRRPTSPVVTLPPP